MKNILLSIMAALFLVVAGCTTSQGSVFDTVKKSPDADRNSPEKPAEESSRKGSEPRKDVKDLGSKEVATKNALRIDAEVSTTEKEAAETILELHTRPEGAKIYLDHTYFGETPKSISGLEPGTYYLTLRKSGYYEANSWIRISANMHSIVSMPLTLVTGYLSVSPVPHDSQIFLDGNRIEAGVTEVPIGQHTLKIKKFGYEEETFPVTIRELRTTTATPDLKPAAFRVSGLSVSRKRLNPENPGTLGRLSVRFEVSAPGTGTAEILDSGGRAVFIRELGPFSDWPQSFSWDGRDLAGRFAPEGGYSVRVTAKGAADTEAVQANASVAVDRGAVIRFATGLGGVSGLLFAPTPSTLPSGSYQVSSVLFGHYDNADDFLLLPWQTFGRIGLTDRLELDLSGFIVFDSLGTNGGLATGALKYRFAGAAGESLSAAVDLRGTVSSYSRLDSYTAFPGVALGLPLEASLGPLSFVLAPEVILSPFRVRYSGGPAESGPYLWGYLRTGAYFDSGTVRTGLSAAFRSLPFSEGLSLELPFQTGFEFHWLVPGTPLYLSFVLTGEWNDTDDFYLSGGGGLGFLH